MTEKRKLQLAWIAVAIAVPDVLISLYLIIAEVINQLNR